MTEAEKVHISETGTYPEVDKSTSWHAYGKSLAVGHRYLTGIFEDEVTVTEKIDGSQFSFGLFDDGLKCRSKGQQINLDCPDKMFIKAVETVKALESELTPYWTYRAEYLNKPKHNVLAYDRHPKGHLIIFDIAMGHEDYCSYDVMAVECERIGMECVPLIYRGMVLNPDIFREFLDRDSILGGQKIEGVVAKNYERFGKDGKVLMAKCVSSKFKEVHNKDWKTQNPTGIDMITKLGLEYHSEARFAKSVQHLREAGELVGAPQDIGKLLSAVKTDIIGECEEEIKQKLWNWAWPKIQKAVASGFPEWYKQLLLEQSFSDLDIEVAEGEDVDERNTDKDGRSGEVPTDEQEQNSKSVAEAHNANSNVECSDEQHREDSGPE
jgi:hypothetical protein